MIDRELYLPRQWADDRARRTAAKVPEDIAFATKPQLAQRMIGRAVAAQVPFAWITGDEVYGDNRGLRVWLEQQELHFVLAVASNQYVWVNVNGQKPVGQLAAMVQPQDWITLLAGDGAKGPRLYDWARIPLLSWQMPGERWLLLRRSLLDAKLAYYVCYAPRQTDFRPWCALPARAGRWKNASKRPREKSGWISMKCAAGTAGTGISPWRCSRMRICRPWPARQLLR